MTHKILSVSFGAIATTMLMVPAIHSQPQHEWHVQYGQAGDIPVPGKYQLGSGGDLAVWRPSNGYWYIYNFMNGQGFTEQWGTAGDIPVPGDYDGDGLFDYCVYRPSDMKWWVKSSRTGAFWTQQSLVPFKSGDVILSGDFDGDGRADYTVWTAFNGKWQSQSSRTGKLTVAKFFTPDAVPVSSRGRTHQFRFWLAGPGQFYNLEPTLPGSFTPPIPGPVLPGLRGDVPLAARFCSLSSSFNPALWRQSDGTFFNTSGSINVRWGLPGDIPVPGDYFGRGVDEFAVWRPSNGTWYIRWNDQACI